MEHVSIRELAAACGVSISTVSKALHGTGRISEETARRIMETAAAMGYTGSQAARALATRPRRIALVLPTAATESLARFRAGCREELPLLSANGIRLVEVVPEEAGELDGVILHASCAPHVSLREGQPCVVIGGRAAALHPVAEITPDARVAGRLAAQFIAFATDGAPAIVLTCRRGNYAEDEAVRGFRELSAKLGVTVAAVSECGDARGLQAELRRIMRTALRVRGIFVTAPLTVAATAVTADLRRKPVLVGADFTRAAQEALRAGSISALLYPAEERQASLAVRSLVAAMSGGTPAGHLTVRQELVLKSNLESYL